MAGIEEIERKLLALPLNQRVFLAESLLASVPPVEEEMSEAEEMAEVERRERQLQTGQVHALTDAEFWREVEGDFR
ncbi:MAG TPA: addiction module protein [Dongiaceae bacterium]|nr:addiction module protein [Dongiaceae bacterium]